MSERPVASGRPAAAVRRVIAPVTLAHGSLEAAAVAADLAAAVRGELVLAGIAPVVCPHPLPSRRYLDVLIRQAKEQELVDRLVGERLDELAALLPARARLRKVLARGPVGATLLRAARQHEADLIVLPMWRGDHDARVPADHADRYVMRHSDVPVVAVPVGVAAPTVRALDGRRPR